MNNFKIKIFAILFIMLTTNFVNAQNQHQCDYTCSPHPFAVRLFGSPMLTQLKSDTYNSEIKSKPGFNIGVDLAYYFFNNGKFKTSISLGLGLTQYNSKYNMTYADSAWATDVDNQDVFIKEYLNNYVENQSAMFLDIPVKLGFEYSISTRLDLYLNLVVNYGVAIANKYDNSVMLTRTGYYPDYNALLYDIDVPGSDYFYPTNKPVSGSGDFDVQNNISFESALGVKYKLNPRLSLFGGLKFMYGFQDIKGDNNQTSQIVTNDYELLSLMNRDDKVTTQAIGAEIGISINLGKCKKTNKTIVEEEVIVKEVTVEYTFTDSETNAPVKANLGIKDNEKLLQSVVSDDKGQTKVYLLSENTYSADYSAEGYDAQNEILNLNNVNTVVKKNIALSKTIENIIIEDTIQDDIPVVIVDTVPSKIVDTTKIEPAEEYQTITIAVVDSKSKKPVKATIEIKQNNRMVQIVEANHEGLALVNIPKGKDYIVIISAEDYVYKYEQVDLALFAKLSKKQYEVELDKIKKNATLELRPVTFKTAMEEIDSTDTETLDLVLRMLNDNPKMEIEVSGHADSNGEYEQNINLSQNRADTIIAYLIKGGANPKQLKSLACGSSLPIADNTTPEGRAKNRRVEFKVLKY